LAGVTYNASDKRACLLRVGVCFYLAQLEMGAEMLGVEDLMHLAIGT
jgi:hypothetical protein